MQITKEQIRKISPHVTNSAADKFVPYINKYAVAYGVTTPQRMAAFLAQLLHESGPFVYVQEIASGKAYEGRKDLGNVIKGDGVKYKGRGLIQLTGRANYEAFSKYLYNDTRLLDTPQLVETPELAVQAAYWFWSVRNDLNLIADKPETWTITSNKKVYGKTAWITKKVNGGQNGLSDRLKYYAAAKKVLF